MKVWKVVKLFEEYTLSNKLNDLQKQGKNIVTVYPSSFDNYGKVYCLTIVYTEEDVEE